jgi:hypothetical protein
MYGMRGLCHELFGGGYQRDPGSRLCIPHHRPLVEGQERIDGRMLLIDRSTTTPDMVNTVNKKQVSIASFFIGVPMLATRFINIFQFMTRGGVIV